MGVFSKFRELLSSKTDAPAPAAVPETEDDPDYYNRMAGRRGLSPNVRRGIVQDRQAAGKPPEDNFGFTRRRKTQLRKPGE